MWAKRAMTGALSGIVRRWGILAAAFAWAAAGCGTAPPPAPPAVRLDVVDHAGLMARVAAHRGKVVVLDCWSLSCPPCVREFPGLVRLAALHPDQVACLSLSFDFEGLGTVAEAAGPVRDFLRSVGAERVENLLSGEEADVMYRKLELASVPAVFVWRPDGSLARRLDDDDARRRLGRAFTYEDVAVEVRDCLAR